MWISIICGMLFVKVVEVAEVVEVHMESSLYLLPAARGQSFRSGVC